MYKIVVSDPLQETGLAMLREAGHDVVDASSAEDKARLPELLADADALVVRSGTQVTAELMAAAPQLKVVGRAGIGVDNIDLQAATARGILVVNAPTANLLSATEHTFALMLALVRNVAVADAALKRENWDRKAFVGAELQGKTLGIIGFGRIGQQVAKRAQVFDMRVVAFDPYLDDEVARKLDVESLDLDALLATSDIISLHTPLTDQTRNLLDEARLAQMKEGAMVINCGRGGVVDEAALLAALESGKLAGAGIDVFATEPPTDFALARHPRVVATPHLGASTKEAQLRVATDTVAMVLEALGGSLAVSAVNLPFRSAGKSGLPYLQLAEKLGLLASGLLGTAPSRITVDMRGIDDGLEESVRVAALKGLLSPSQPETVNYVNAAQIAASRSVHVSLRKSDPEPGDYPQQIGVRVEGHGTAIEVDGTLFHGNDPRVVRLDGYQLEFRPQDVLLVVRNDDVPGVVGQLGTALGGAEVNIADLHLARQPGGHEALAVVRLDQTLPVSVLSFLRDLPAIRNVRIIDLGAA